MALVEEAVAALQPYVDQITIDVKTYDVVRCRALSGCKIVSCRVHRLV